MKTTQHTSGDWYVERIPKMADKQPHDHDMWSVYSTKRTRYNDKPQDICSFNWLTPEGKANAHLISAAPDLLDALKALMVTEHMLRDPKCKVMKSARLAIAKAEGAAQ